MTLADWIAVAVILLVIGGAAAYIIKAKKSGKKCIGCPYSSTCGKTNGAGNSCSCRCGGSTSSRIPKNK